MQIYLAGGEIKMISHSIRGVHKYLWYRGQVFYALPLEPKEVSVNGLPMNCLKKQW